MNAIITQGTQWSAKLAEVIDKGRTSAANVIQQVQTQIPEDALVPGPALNFDAETLPSLRVNYGDRTGYHGIHAHALGQFAERARVPQAYVSRLVEEKGDWAKPLLAQNFNTIYHEMKQKFLVRRVDNEVRGFLSDQFKRIDARPLLDAFCTACSQVGAEPYMGHALATRIGLKAIVPQVYEPVAGRPLAFGLFFGTSDFGAGALEVSFFALELWCLNGAIAQKELRAVHVGKRITGDLTLSNRTMQLETRATASVVQDIVTSRLAEDALEQFQDGIRAANAKIVNPNEARKALAKALTKPETEQVVEAFAGMDVTHLPPGQTQYRLSNALSWIAQKVESEDRRLELERLAGQYLQAA